LKQGDKDFIGFLRAEQSTKDIDEDALRVKYEAFQRQRADNSSSKGHLDQYMHLEGKFAEYLTDPYSTEVAPREAINESVEVLIVGGGFSALLTIARLRDAGVTNIRIVEKGGDVGGTWYWNRYPGAACDVESYSYLPLLEELNYVPQRKYADGPEIYAHCKRIAEKYKVYDACLFHTTVLSTKWDEGSTSWQVTTDRGDAINATHVIMANGCLTEPKLAVIEGMETYSGKAFHTSR
jgi:cyclohexanone monooxygenase